MKGRMKFLVVLVVLALPAALLVGAASAQPELTPVQALGKAIFFDQDLSLNHNQACAACHDPVAGWTGPTSSINAHGAVYEGSISGAFGNRKPPSAAYATQAPILHMTEPGEFEGGNFWDGRATGEKLGNPAADQAQGPFLNPKEQALDTGAEVVFRVCAASYGALFREVWGVDACDPANADMAYDQVALSIAAFEGSPEVNAFSSKFDAKVAGMDRFTKDEQKGFALFKGKAKCARCHTVSGQDSLFTDYTYDNLGIPVNPENPMVLSNPGWKDPGLGGFLASRSDYASYAEENLGKFKVPTLRNVGLGLDAVPQIQKAYGHNGYFKSLGSIVHFYNTRDVLDTCPGPYAEAQALAENCWPAPEYPQTVNDEELGNLRLTPQQEADLVAFLKTLSDGYVPAP